MTNTRVSAKPGQTQEAIPHTAPCESRRTGATLKWLLVLSICLFPIHRILHANIIIDSPTVWNETNGPTIVAENITIQAGASLTIERKSIEIQGSGRQITNNGGTLALVDATIQWSGTGARPQVTQKSGAYTVLRTTITDVSYRQEGGESSFSRSKLHMTGGGFISTIFSGSVTAFSTLFSGSDDRPSIRLLFIGSESSLATIDECVFSNSSSYEALASVGIITLRKSLFHNLEGVQFYGGTSNLETNTFDNAGVSIYGEILGTLRKNKFINNLDFGLWVGGDNTYTIEENSFVNNRVGIVIAYESQVDLRNNSFLDQTEAFLQLWGPAHPKNIDTNIVKSDHGYHGIWVDFNAYSGLEIDRISIWDSQRFPYLVERFRAEDPRLTLIWEAGVVVKFFPEIFGRISEGRLETRGTQDRPVILTALEDDSAGGDSNQDGNASLPTAPTGWAFDIYGEEAQFNHTHVRWGGTDFFGAITLNGGQVRNSIFENNHIALRIEGHSKGTRPVTVSNSSFAKNKSHIHLGWDIPRVDITGSNFLQPADSAIVHSGTTVITARHNWWGDPSGPLDTTDDRAQNRWYNPNGKGFSVPNTIDYNPWLGSTPLLNPSIKIEMAGRTSDTLVHLALAVEGPAKDMIVAEHPFFAGASWEPFNKEKSLNVSQGDGPKIIHAQFRAEDGSVSEIVYDTIQNGTNPSTATVKPLEIVNVTKVVRNVRFDNEEGGTEYFLISNGTQDVWRNGKNTSRPAYVLGLDNVFHLSQPWNGPAGPLLIAHTFDTSVRSPYTLRLHYQKVSGSTATLTVFCPAFTTSNGRKMYFYVAEDGSTYYADRNHIGLNQEIPELLLPGEALVPAHLARAAEPDHDLDFEAPAPVTDLHAVSVSSSSVVLVWTLTGDDGMEGATDGRLRIVASTRPFNSYEPSPVPGATGDDPGVVTAPIRLEPGATASWTLEALSPGTTYHISLFLADASLTWSNESNRIAVQLKPSAMNSAMGDADIPESANTAFRWGEVYVYPNPAKHGAAPVFHVESGLADRVIIHIFDVTGRPLTELTSVGHPAVHLRGQTPVLSYKIPWTGAVPSGVYIYSVTAEKSGDAPLRKSGKFSVVR